MSRPKKIKLKRLAWFIFAILVITLLLSCAPRVHTLPARKHVLYIRKDGTFASAGDSFKERW